MKSRKKDSNSSERTLARSVDCTSKCRAHPLRRFNVCCIYVYMGYYSRARVSEILHHCMFCISLSIFFLLLLTRGWMTITAEEEGGSVLRRLHYFLLLSSILNDRPIRSWNQNVSVRENSIARHDYSFWSEKLSECEGGEIWIRITVPRRRPYRRRTDRKSWIFLAEWKLFQELQHASISCCLMC